MEKFLSVSGFGDVYEPHYESGYALAKEYFESRNLDFLECFEAYEQNKDSKLGKHWLEAGRYTNLALYAWNLQDSSCLTLEVVDEDYY